MLRVVLTGEYGKVFLDPVKHAVGQENAVDLWLPSEGAERMVEIAREAEVIVASAEWVLHEKRTLVKRTLQNAEKLKLILVPFSGMDWLDRAWLPAGSVVCNTNVGIDPIAEYVMLAMLQSAIPLREMDSELRAARWGWGGASVLGRKHHELQGRTIGLVGYGRIGHRVAELSKAFRMRVIAVSRNPWIDHSLDWYKGTDSLDDLLAQSDYVLLSVPGGPETQGLIGAAQLACMKADAVLINIARGSVVALLHNPWCRAASRMTFTHNSHGGAPVNFAWTCVDSRLFRARRCARTSTRRVNPRGSIASGIGRHTTPD
ncbi:hypothetical protein BJN34_25685 [Cupriavidus necator]|uniref:D-isomer specific 2-hydroxyacid dehydrogenase NAD-binding domain-containing protein n=1 Tax=Cupriavidus necator TaxID=106590 RepID=A0A1U9UYR4_CUPNE|nr:NAD(P)-dependent oxidoreductase [Cupriavidus necator]AQV97255.1 hypothetical protein BJN34_25685 [Cupriavidus necator]